jgi:cytochrome c5
MRIKFIITFAIVFILGLVLTACGSKTKAPDTQVPAVKATDTQPPIIQATKTQPPVVQATNTQPPAAQVTDTQPPALQATNTPLPANTATVASVGPDGAALLNDRCTICHNLDRVTSLKNSAAQWTRIVSRMIQNGAQLTPAEQTALVDYLAKTYGP